jgi:hypothetical protein
MRADLHEVPLDSVWPPKAGQIVLTISVGQALSMIHRIGYEQGFYLLELDDHEIPIRAYHKGPANGQTH